MNIWFLVVAQAESITIEPSPWEKYSTIANIVLAVLSLLSAVFARITLRESKAMRVAQTTPWLIPSIELEINALVVRVKNYGTTPARFVCASAWPTISDTNAIAVRSWGTEIKRTSVLAPGSSFSLQISASYSAYFDAHYVIGENPGEFTVRLEYVEHPDERPKTYEYSLQLGYLTDMPVVTSDVETQELNELYRWRSAGSRIDIDSVNLENLRKIDSSINGAATIDALAHLASDTDRYRGYLREAKWETYEAKEERGGTLFVLVKKASLIESSVAIGFGIERQTALSIANTRAFSIDRASGQHEDWAIILSQMVAYGLVTPKNQPRSEQEPGAQFSSAPNA